MLKYFGLSLCFLLAVFEGAAGQTILARLSALECKASALERNASALECKDSALESNASALEITASAMESLARAMESLASALERNASALESKASALERNASALESKVSSLESKASALESKASALESKATAMGSNITSLQAQIQKQAAFSARFNESNNEVLNIGQKDPIRFPIVVTNIGNGYSPLTGNFTAPYSGVYVFFLHVRVSSAIYTIALGIYKDNQELVFGVAENANMVSGKDGILVTTYLNAGDNVYCRQSSGYNLLEKTKMLTFSGFLVHAD